MGGQLGECGVTWIMMSGRLSNWAWVLAVFAVASMVSAESADPVPTYTNADLQKFGEPEPVAPPPEDTEVDRQWEFVHDYLDREYSRIDSDRRHTVDRALTEAAEPAPSDTWRGYGVYAPGLFGYGRGIGRPSRPGNRDRRALPRYDTRTARHGYYVPAKRHMPVKSIHKSGGNRGGAKPGRGGGRRR